MPLFFGCFKRVDSPAFLPSGLAPPVFGFESLETPILRGVVVLVVACGLDGVFGDEVGVVFDFGVEVIDLVPDVGRVGVAIFEAAGFVTGEFLAELGALRVAGFLAAMAPVVFVVGALAVLGPVVPVGPVRLAVVAPCVLVVVVRLTPTVFVAPADLAESVVAGFAPPVVPDDGLPPVVVLVTVVLVVLMVVETVVVFLVEPTPDAPALLLVPPPTLPEEATSLSFSCFFFSSISFLFCSAASFFCLSFSFLSSIFFFFSSSCCSFSFFALSSLSLMASAEELVGPFLPVVADAGLGPVAAPAPVLDLAESVLDVGFLRPDAVVRALEVPGGGERNEEMGDTSR